MKSFRFYFVLLICLQSVCNILTTTQTTSIVSKSDHLECSSSFNLYSSGPAGRIQGSVMGNYVQTGTELEGWPTWKAKCRDDRYLYRCPCDGGNTWLFGRQIGDKVGWIKQASCNFSCPEHCYYDSRQNWQYWNDDEKQWHPDSSIRLYLVPPNKPDKCDTPWNNFWSWINSHFYIFFVVGGPIIAVSYTHLTLPTKA